MAFFGIFVVTAAMFVTFVTIVDTVIFIGLGLFVAGTIFMRRMQRKRLGTCLRILGYIVSIPAFIIGFPIGTIFVLIPTIFGIICAIFVCKIFARPKE